MADGSGGFSSHLITPKTPESKSNKQPAKTNNIAELGRNRALLELDSETTEKASIPTRILELAEADAHSNSKNSQFSETLKNYVAYRKSIKCPKIVNSDLLDGVDRISRSNDGGIKLAESSLGSSKSQPNLSDPGQRDCL